MSRGSFNKGVQEAAKKHIDREISLIELRLIPYIQYVMTNDQKVDPRRINQEERDVLSSWRKDGFIGGGATRLSITKEFWDFMCEVLFYSYVTY